MPCHRLSFFLLFFKGQLFVCMSAEEVRKVLEVWQGQRCQRCLWWLRLWRDTVCGLFCSLVWHEKLLSGLKIFTVFTFERVGWQMSTGVWASGVALFMLFDLCIMAVLRSSRVCQVFWVQWRNDWGTRVHLSHCWKQPQRKTRVSVASAITYASTSAEDGKAVWFTSAVAVWKESSNSSASLNLVYLRSASFFSTATQPAPGGGREATLGWEIERLLKLTDSHGYCLSCCSSLTKGLPGGHLVGGERGGSPTPTCVSVIAWSQGRVDTAAGRNWIWF